MILNEIAAATKKRVEACKQKISQEEMKQKARSLPVDGTFPFEIPLRSGRAAFICEIKKASPSKGIIAEEFPYLDIAREYKAAGADCISVLTEPDYFMGSSRYLEEIHGNVDIPLLRKDFTIDEYMIYEAKVIGASACSESGSDCVRAWGCPHWWKPMMRKRSAAPSAPGRGSSASITGI